MESVMSVSYHYLFIMSVPLFILYILHVVRSSIQGMGDTIIPMISGITEMIMRVCVVLLLPQFFGQESVYFAEVAAWVGADVILVSAYIYKIKNLKKDFESSM